MKKIYNAPYLKVVEVKNDIIATSLTGGEDWNEGIGRTQGREDFFGDDEY